MNQRGRFEIGTFRDVVCMTGYAPLTERTVNVMPSLDAPACTTGSVALSTALTSVISSTFLHSFALQTPFEFAYFESFISARAFATFPRSPGVLNGAKLSSFPSSIAFGRMCWAMSPETGPPQAFRSAFRSMTQFIARRTWTSSNGGCVRFIVM